MAKGFYCIKGTLNQLLDNGILAWAVIKMNTIINAFHVMMLKISIKSLVQKDTHTQILR